MTHRDDRSRTPSRDRRDDVPREAGRGAPSVRLATVADARGIAEVHVAAWRAAYPGLLPQAVLDALSVDARERRWASILAEAGPHDRYTVAERDGRIVGWCGSGPRRDRDTGEGEIHGLYAHPDVWGSGCGAALLADAFAHLGGVVVVWTLVGNDRAIAAYERAGFATTDEVAPVDGHPGARQQLLRR